MASNIAVPAEKHLVKDNIFVKWKSSAPYFQSMLRIVSAITFMTNGTMKLFAFPIGMPPNNSKADVFTLVGIGGILELFGGALILIGLFTRPVAFLLCGEMAVAYFKFHDPISPWPIINNGIAAVLYCFIWLYFSAAGAGPWSLDAKLKRDK